MGMKEQIAQAQQTLDAIDAADRGNAAGAGSATQPTAPNGAAGGDGTPITTKPGANTPPGTTAGQSPTADPTATPDGSTDEIAQLRAALESRERQLRSQAGTHGQKMKELTDQVRQMGLQITELVEENRRMREQGTQQPAPAATGPQGVPQKGTAAYKSWLKSEVMDELGTQTAQALADSVDARMQPMESKLSELEAERQKLAREREELAQRDAKRSKAEAFWNDVEKLAPGARAVNGDPANGIPADPQFSEFLDSVDEVTGMTWRERASSAMQSGRIAGVAAVFKGFFSFKRGAANGPETHVEPRGTTGREPPMSSGGQPVQRLTQEQFAAKAAELRQRAAKEPGNIRAITQELDALNAAFFG
jgi:hypothetical protein